MKRYLNDYVKVLSTNGEVAAGLCAFVLCIIPLLFLLMSYIISPWFILGVVITDGLIAISGVGCFVEQHMKCYKLWTINDHLYTVIDDDPEKRETTCKEVMEILLS